MNDIEKLSNEKWFFTLNHLNNEGIELSTDTQEAKEQLNQLQKEKPEVYQKMVNFYNSIETRLNDLVSKI